MGANHIAYADKLGNKTTYLEKFSSRKDVDVLRFRLDEGEGVEITTEIFNNQDPDTILALYDSRGKLIDVDNNSGPGAESQLVFTNAGPADRFYVATSAFNRFPDDAIGEGDFNGPDHRGRGGPEDLYINYSVNFDYF